MVSTDQKMKIIAYSSIISWKIPVETMKTERDFIFLGSKVTADSDGKCEKKKRCLLLGRKAMKNLDNILKSRDITLPAKICTVKAMVLREVVTGC